MEIKDSIYGPVTVEPILEQLIQTTAVQRLKQIHQGGASYLVNPIWNVTRYEHSIGTMVLIRLMGGSLEEQIAGLLHDISHTAFSHVIDFVLKHKNEDYHETIYEKVIYSSEIPQILKDYGYDYRDILFNESKWTILEQPAPKLCADRVDYTLRDMYHYGYITKQEIENFLSNLTILNGEMLITSQRSAEWFVETYYKEVIDYFMHPLAIYGNHQLSKALKLALELEEVQIEDFLKDDMYVLNLLQQSKSNGIRSLLSSMNQPVQFIHDKEHYDIAQKNKVRIIDPTLLINDSICMTSQKSVLTKSLTESALNRAKEGVYLKVKKIP